MLFLRFLSDTFIKDSGHHGEGLEIINVLNGTYTPPPTTTQATQDFLTACRTQQSTIYLAKPLEAPARYKIQKQFWNIQKEKTTTYN